MWIFGGRVFWIFGSSLWMLLMIISGLLVGVGNNFRCIVGLLFISVLVLVVVVFSLMVLMLCRCIRLLLLLWMIILWKLLMLVRLVLICMLDSMYCFFIIFGVVW